MQTGLKNKQRSYLDPIHGPITLYMDDPVDNLLVRLIDTKEFQRLRRVRQMGTGWFVFHGAEHTRFGHSMGAMFIAGKIINHLARTHLEINKYELQILTAALLHDLGHGPFSHTAEKFTSFSHEQWTHNLITGDTEINSLLCEFDKNLPEDIIKLMQYKEFPCYASQIVSSYVDCDRLDYLHRDSYYTGVPYGLTGSGRIIFSFEIDEETKQLVVRENIGLDAVIHYLHARYSMYQQVYQHKKNIASDFILRMIGERIKKVRPYSVPRAIMDWLNPQEKPMPEISTDSFLKVDDYLLISTIENISSDGSSEKILKDLCERFIRRNLFKSYEFRPDVSPEQIDSAVSDIRKIAEKNNFDPNFYVGKECSSSKPYEPYIASGDKTGKAVFIKQKNGEVRELSEISGLVKALSAENIVKTCLIFTPEIEDEINNKTGLVELFK